jgi:hypothetical protein
MLSSCFPCLESRQIYVVMVSISRMRLLGDDIGRILEETLSDSGYSLFDWDDDSSVTEDLPIHEAVAIKWSENEDSDSVQDSTSALPGGASIMAFTWRTWLIM